MEDAEDDLDDEDEEDDDEGIACLMMRGSRCLNRVNESAVRLVVRACVRMHMREFYVLF